MEKGFRYDRRWMLVNQENGHVTQRTHPHLSQIGISLTDESIIATHRDMPDLEVPLTLNLGKHIQVTVWDDQVDALEAPQNINNWFSKLPESHANWFLCRKLGHVRLIPSVLSIMKT